VEYRLTVIGRKARDYFRKRGFSIHEELLGIGDEIDFIVARDLARKLTEAYRKGEVDEVRLVYMRFVSAAVHRPTVATLLPIEPPGRDGDAKEDATEAEGVDYIYEPNP